MSSQQALSLRSVRHLMLCAVGGVLALSAAALGQSEAQIQAHNAARADKGGLVTLQLLGKDTRRNAQTPPDMIVDGNARSRTVLENPPYLFRIDLVETLPISHIHFICTNYEGEQSPEKIEVRLSDGTVIEKTLEVIRPTSANRKPRQTIEIGDKPLKWVEVKVLSHHPGTARYGGIGEIEVITSANLAEYLTVPDYNPEAPTYIEPASPRSDYSDTQVTLPEPIPAGTFPGIYLTRDEIVALRQQMQQSERAQPALRAVVEGARGALDRPIEFPDPQVPAQLKHRNDPAAKAHSELSKLAGRLGWAYQFTDDERFAQKAREILVGYARLYPNDYAEHKGVNRSDTGKVMAQRLSEAMWLLPLIQAYDLIHDSPALSAEDRTLIENDLIRTALTFIQRRDAATEVARRDSANPNWRNADPAAAAEGSWAGNWINFYNAAYIQGGIVLGDQDWIDIGAAGTRNMIVKGIGDDGMWREGAIGYQIFARMALIACLEPLARRGIDLYSYDQHRVKNLWDSPLKLAYPDGTIAGINDTGRASAAGSWQAMAFDYAWLRWRDPNYGVLINRAPRQIHQSEAIYFPAQIYETLPEKPLEGIGSALFDTVGYAIMRGEDGGGSTFFLLKYGPHGGVHGHPDKLNLILFADGDELSGEPVMYRYEDPRHQLWTKSTIGHWTLAVNERNQTAHTGKLLLYSHESPINVVRGVSTEAYPGVALDRTVVQMPGYLVDVFRAWGRSSRTFDYPLTFRGRLDGFDGESPDLKPMGSAEQIGYSQIRTAEPVKTDGNWIGAWQRPADTDGERPHPANHVRVIVAGAPESEIYTGRNVDGRDQVIIRRTGTEAVFGAVIDPYQASDAVAAVERFEVSGPVPAYGLRIRRTDGGTDLIVVRYDPQTDSQPAAASSVEQLKTNALVTVVRLDSAGKVIGMGLFGGTEASYADQRLSLDSAGNKWMQ